MNNVRPMSLWNALFWLAYKPIKNLLPQHLRKSLVAILNACLMKSNAPDQKRAESFEKKKKSLPRLLNLDVGKLSPVEQEVT